MNRKQLAAIGFLPLLVVTMTLVFRLLARVLPARRAWYAGFVVYWGVCCLFFPLKLLGRRPFQAMFARRRPGVPGGLLMALPPLLAGLDAVFHEREPRSKSEKAGLIVTAVMNGTLEEVLWRGVYMLLFGDRPLWGVVWPTLWFALWHYAPGSILPDANVGQLVGGAAVLGGTMSWLTMRSKSVCSAAVAHTLAGLARLAG